MASDYVSLSVFRLDLTARPVGYLPGWGTTLPEGELRALAERAAGGLNMSYAGVDLMRDGDGKWWVLEVDSIPACKGLQIVISIDIAACLINDLVRRCRPAAPGEVAN